MKIAFIDFINWDYNIETVYQKPLGGAHSALCYLAEALAKKGHEVFLLNNTTKAENSCGVACFSLKTVADELLQSLDVLIITLGAGQGSKLKPFLRNNTRMILWTQHAHDQPGVQALHNSLERDIYDGMFLVSNWQRDRFYQHFKCDLSRTFILRNAIAPFFSQLFPDNTPILPHKSQPPVLAYTSTPFRGLDLLLDIFPKIRAAIPGTKLKVFSSMKVYQVKETEDEYASLYLRCQETEGVEYIGSLSQPELAKELKSITALVYPNTFAETSCIAVMEAMASGCWVVTSDLGALPETTAGFASLIPINNDWETYKNLFIQATIKVLQTSAIEAENHLRKQVDYVNQNYNWNVRAEQLIELINNITPKPPLPQKAESNQQQNYELIPVNLKAINLIAFPDWNQSEEVINLELSRVIKSFLTHPDKNEMTLLIEASQISEEDGNLALSAVIMNLLMEEELDIEEEPNICLIRDLNSKQWSALLPRIQYRIVLENEDKKKAEKAILLEKISSTMVWEIVKPPSLEKYKNQITKLVENNPYQLSIEEYSYITDLVSKRAPGNFLIFSLGKDSGLWLEVNKNGKTVFLEDNIDWFNEVTKNYPEMEAYLVKYGTKRKEWLKLLLEYNQGYESLSMELPAHILESKWDFIFVDAPAGYSDEMPGRMKSIYLAAQLAFKSEKTDIFVHDCDRIVENIYGGYFLHQENFVTQVRKLNHYRIGLMRRQGA